jgi:hypothetical protein
MITRPSLRNRGSAKNGAPAAVELPHASQQKA